MIPVLRHRNTQLFVDQTPLQENKLEETYLTADISASSSTLTVKNIDGFAIDQILLIGEFGDEDAEIIKTHGSTAPSGSTITLVANTTFAHSMGVKVYRLQYDQVEISHATTATGSKSVLETTNLDAHKKVWVTTDTTKTTGFYFARFKETIGGTFGNYTDALAYGGWAKDTVGYMITRALRNLKLTLSDMITREDCYEWINSGLRLIQGKLKRWPEHYSYNSILGQAQRGTNVLTMPSDAYDTETNKSIIALRIGDNNKLDYLSPVFFDEEMDNVKVTQVRTAASATDTTLDLDNSYDLSDSGSVNVYISGTKYNITYTGVTRDDVSGATAQLTGIPASGTGSITVTIPVDTYVWSDEEEGIPDYFTVRNGKIEWWPLTDGSEDNANIYADYAKVVTSVDSDGDTIDYQRYDMLQDYLTWRIKMKDKNDGDLDYQDGYYLAYKEKLNDAIRTLPQNNKFPMRPKINKMSKRGLNLLQTIPIEDQ